MDFGGNIEYKPSFHGDPARGHKFWEYKNHDNPPNFMKWDYKQSGDKVCCNNDKTGEHEYTCKGHQHGCHILPSHHGDPSRDYNFWVYTDGREIVNAAWDYHKVPCDNFIYLKKDGPVYAYKCLGHQTTFHGDPTRDHKLWKYDAGAHLENFLKWDFVDDIEFICTHHSHEGGNEYKCHGHSRGDYLVPTFHGDPSRNYKFWVYPSEKEIVTVQWDFRTPDICNNHVHIGEHDGISEYECKGHSVTYHGDPHRDHSFWLYDHNAHCENEGKWDFKTEHASEACSHHKHIEGQHYQCLGHSQEGDSVWPSHHGDPQRDFHFWVYPQHKGLVNPVWDFRYNVCSNSEHIGTNGEGVQEYKCKGHKYGSK